MTPTPRETHPTLCMEQDPEAGWYCSRPRGHMDAQHVAHKNHDLGTPVLAAWASEPAKAGWICGKCAREAVRGEDDGQIRRHHQSCPKWVPPARKVNADVVLAALREIGAGIDAGPRSGPLAAVTCSTAMAGIRHLIAQIEGQAS